MKHEARNIETTSEGFTMIPHSVFEWLLTTDLSKREQKVAWLIVRLTYGCRNSFAATFKQADLKSIGIGESHAKEVIGTLIDKKIITKSRMSNSFRLNVPERKKNSETTYRLRRLIRRNTYQSGNSSTTISVISTLPNQKANTYRSSKTVMLPKKEAYRLRNGENSSSKDTETEGYKSDKRNNHVPASYVEPQEERLVAND